MRNATKVQILAGPPSASGNSSVGRALAFQANCRGFEPRFPLQDLCGYFQAFSKLEQRGSRGRAPLQAFGRDSRLEAWIVYAHVAQQVEHILGKDGVIGSIPIVGSN